MLSNYVERRYPLPDLALDTDAQKVKSFLAWQLAARVFDQMAGTVRSDLARAGTLADRALTSFPGTALAHFAKAQVLRAQQRFKEAFSEYETVLAISRNWVHAIAAPGYCKFITGPIDEAIPAQERAVRLSPRDPRIWQYYYWIGQVHVLQSRIDQAALWFQKARLRTVGPFGGPNVRALFEGTYFVGLRRAGMLE